MKLSSAQQAVLVQPLQFGAPCSISALALHPYFGQDQNGLSNKASSL